MPERHLSAVPDTPATKPKPKTITWPEMDEHHKRHLRQSGLTAKIVRERGYRSIHDPEELDGLGFILVQQRKGLLIPIWWTGEVVSHQLKPDHPRKKEGRLLKYESPTGKTLHLDCHPHMWRKLQDPNEPLLITEGIKKGDAAARHGSPCIAMAGVDCWVRKVNGESRPLDDWDDVPLDGRLVYIVFDSDVVRKAPVQGARRRLTAFLAGKGAQVMWVDLPDGNPDDDLFYDGRPIKQGLDDYLAAGHPLEELLTEAKAATDEEIRAKQHERYVFHRADDAAKKQITDEAGVSTPFKRWTVAELLAEEAVFQWAAYDLLSSGSYGIISGLFKTLKTYVSAFINVGLASGMGIFDRFTVPQAIPVRAYVGEGGRIPYRRRLERVARSMGVDLNDLPLELVFDVAPIGSPRFEESFRRDLEAMGGPGHVSLDPLYAYHAADVDPRNLYQRGAMLTSLSQPCIEAGSSLLVVDHFNQTGTGAGLGRVSQAGVQEWADTWCLLSHRTTPDVPAGKFSLLLGGIGETRSRRSGMRLRESPNEGTPRKSGRYPTA